MSAAGDGQGSLRKFQLGHTLGEFGCRLKIGNGKAVSSVKGPATQADLPNT